MIREQLGRVSLFYGDDSSWNSNYTETLWGYLSRVRWNGKTIRESGLGIGTEAVLEDVYKRKEVIPDASVGGLGGIWFGVEALDPREIDKGQDLPKIQRVFSEMRKHGMNPMAMTILFPSQGWTGNESNPYGARDTAEWLSRLGASYFQMTHIGPSVGSQDYDLHYERGEVLSRVGRYEVGDNCYDGNRVILDSHPEKKCAELFKRQLYILGAYWTFYSPWKLLVTCLRFLRVPCRLTKNDVRSRFFGLLQTAVTTVKMIPWIYALWRGPWQKWRGVPCTSRKLQFTQDPQLIKLIN